MWGGGGGVGADVEGGTKVVEQGFVPCVMEERAKPRLTTGHEHLPHQWTTTAALAPHLSPFFIPFYHIFDAGAFSGE